MSDRGNQGFSQLHCAVVAEQVQGGSAVLGTMPVDVFVFWARSSLCSLSTVVIDIPGGSDDFDRCPEFLIAEPALTFLSALEPSSYCDADKTHNGTDNSCKEAIHPHKVTAEDG